MPQDLLSSFSFALCSVCSGTHNGIAEQDWRSEGGTARQSRRGGSWESGTSRWDEESLGDPNPISGSRTNGSGNGDSRGGGEVRGRRIDEATKPEAEGAKASTITSRARGGEERIGGDDGKVEGTATRHPGATGIVFFMEVCIPGTNRSRER